MTNTITSPHDADVAHIIKVLLVSRGLKHSDLAAELGMDNGSMSRALNGRRKWTVEEIKHVADYLDTSVEVLLGNPADLLKNRCFPMRDPPGPGQLEFHLAA